MKPSEKNNAEAPSSTAPYDYLGNSCSSMDCTGLIPSLPVSDEELDAYKEVYQFRPPVIRVNKKNHHHN